MASVKPSYVALNKAGTITASHDPNRVQYMASTTKMVVFDYLLTLMDQGKLPASFIKTNMNDATLMMYKSDNDAADRLVLEARKHLGGTSGALSQDAFYRGLNSWVDQVIANSGVTGQTGGRYTHIANASGLDNTGNGGYFYGNKLNQSSALEMAILTRHYATAHDGKATEAFTKSSTFINHVNANSTFASQNNLGRFTGRGIYDNSQARAAGVDFVKTGTGRETDIGPAIGTDGRHHRVFSRSNGDVVALLAYGSKSRVNLRAMDLAVDGVPARAPVTSGRGNILARTSEADLKSLAAIIYAEAHTEPYLGQVAVGEVILNRTRRPKRFSGTISGVISDPDQFEPFTRGTYAAAKRVMETKWDEYFKLAIESEQKMAGNTETAHYVNAIRAARLALSGSNVIGDADHFLNPDVVEARSGPLKPNTWQFDTRKNGVQIGGHYFSTEKPGQRSSYIKPNGAEMAKGLDVDGADTFTAPPYRNRTQPETRQSDSGSWSDRFNKLKDWFANSKNWLLGGGLIAGALGLIYMFTGSSKPAKPESKDSGWGLLGSLTTMAVLIGGSLLAWRYFDKKSFDENVTEPVTKLASTEDEKAAAVIKAATLLEGERQLQCAPKLACTDVDETKPSHARATGVPLETKTLG